MGAVGAPEPLDRLVGPPAGLQQIVDAPLRVAGREIGVVAAPGAARHGEDEDALGSVHEGGGLGEIGGWGPVPQGEAVAAALADAEDAARPSGDLGDRLVAEALQDLVQRGGDGGERGEPLDHVVAPLDGLAADDGVAVRVPGGARHQVPLVVGEGFVKLDGERVLQEVEHVFARREVDREVLPLRCGDLGEAAFHQRLAGGDELDDGGSVPFEVALDRADQRGALHRGEQVSEEALLGALEGGPGGGLRVPVERFGAAHDAGRLERFLEVAVDDLEGAGVGVVDAPLLGR